MGLVLRRLALVPVGLFLVATLAFVLIDLTPGDPVELIAGELSTQEQRDEIRAALGLDRPVTERYWTFIGDLARLDLGTSLYSRRPVVDEIQARLPSSLVLVAMSLTTAVTLGVGLGAAGAIWFQRWPDRLSRTTVAIAQSVPDFFLALVLIYVFFFVLRVAPAPVGQLGLLNRPPPAVTGSVIVDALIARDWSSFWVGLRHALLPVATLGVFYSSYFARLTRSLLRPALQSDHAQFARATGLNEPRVVFYALRSISAPLITYGAILLAALTGGAAIVELVFAWGGVGQWAIESILKLDIPAIQGFVVVTGALVLFIYLSLDLVVSLIDPRARPR